MIRPSSEKVKGKIRRFLIGVSVFCTVASGFALSLSLPMPGVGWILAAFALTAVSLLTPWVGRSYVFVSLVVSIVHLFTFGPLSLLVSDGSLMQLPMFYLLIFIVVPFGIALVSILLPVCRRRRNISVKDQ